MINPDQYIERALHEIVYALCCLTETEEKVARIDTAREALRRAESFLRKAALSRPQGLTG